MLSKTSRKSVRANSPHHCGVTLDSMACSHASDIDEVTGRAAAAAACSGLTSTLCMNPPLPVHLTVSPIMHRHDGALVVHVLHDRAHQGLLDGRSRLLKRREEELAPDVEKPVRMVPYTTTAVAPAAGW